MFSKYTYLLIFLMSFAIWGVSCTDTTLTDHYIDSKHRAILQKSESQLDKKNHDITSELLMEVKKKTARYHSTTQAIQNGYVEDTHCVSNPDKGGMGYHWLNEGLVDPVFDPLNPEALIYERDKNGNPKLIAVEYIVIDVGQPHPHFGDQPFDIGGTPVPVDHYSLHVWIYKDNPSGTFEPYNPNVSCD